MDKKQ